MSAPLNDWTLRLTAERNEMEERIWNLERFLAEPTATAPLGETERGLLRAQLAAMCTYLSILNLRVDHRRYS